MALRGFLKQPACHNRHANKIVTFSNTSANYSVLLISASGCEWGASSPDTLWGGVPSPGVPPQWVPEVAAAPHLWCGSLLRPGGHGDSGWVQCLSAPWSESRIFNKFLQSLPFLVFWWWLEDLQWFEPLFAVWWQYVFCCFSYTLQLTLYTAFHFVSIMTYPLHFSTWGVTLLLLTYFFLSGE